MTKIYCVGFHWIDCEKPKTISFWLFNITNTIWIEFTEWARTHTHTPPHSARKTWPSIQHGYPFVGFDILCFRILNVLFQWFSSGSFVCFQIQTHTHIVWHAYWILSHYEPRYVFFSLSSSLHSFLSCMFVTLQPTTTKK